MAGHRDAHVVMNIRANNLCVGKLLDVRICLSSTGFKQKDGKTKTFKLNRKRYSDRPSTDYANVVRNIVQALKRLVYHPKYILSTAEDGCHGSICK